VKKEERWEGKRKALKEVKRRGSTKGGGVFLDREEGGCIRVKGRIRTTFLARKRGVEKNKRGIKWRRKTIKRAKAQRSDRVSESEARGLRNSQNSLYNILPVMHSPQTKISKSKKGKPTSRGHMGNDKGIEKEISPPRDELKKKKKSDLQGSHTTKQKEG